MPRVCLRRFISVIGLVCLCLTVASGALAQRGRELGPATEPMPPRTMDRHDGFLEIAGAGDIDLLFVGDSITDGWDNRGEAVYNEHFVPLKVANFGIGGDTTQGVLWRMRNGELEGFEARLIVHMLGTNNINRNSNEDIVAGNRAIVEEYQGPPAAGQGSDPGCLSARRRARQSLPRFDCRNKRGPCRPGR